MTDDDFDARMCMAAFERVRRLNEVQNHLTADELKPGFEFKGERSADQSAAGHLQTAADAL